MFELGTLIDLVVVAQVAGNYETWRWLSLRDELRWSG